MAFFWKVKQIVQCVLEMQYILLLTKYLNNFWGVFVHLNMRAQVFPNLTDAG